MVDAIKHRLNFQDYFHCIVTSAEVNVGKPAPDVYLEAAKQLNVSPENCLVFEDIPMGMLAGKNAGMKVCGVHDYSSMDQEDLKKKHCDYYIQSFHDLFFYQARRLIMNSNFFAYLQAGFNRPKYSTTGFCLCYW